MKSLTKYREDEGIITIEASLVFVVFFMGFLILNSLFLSTYTESNTKKAIHSMAIELSHYSLILEKAGLSSYFEMGEKSDLLEELIKIGKKNIKDLGDETFEAKSFYKDILSLFSDKASYQAKSYLYNKAFRQMIKKHLKSDAYLINKGIVNDYEGLEFSNSRILDDGDFEINLTYTIDSTRFLPFKLSRKIKQKALISTNIEGTSLKFSSQDEDKEDSIWTKDNFTRGRYFATYIRKNTSGRVLKLGQGLDLYSPEENLVSQFHSINIFSKSYSDFKDGKYSIKTDDFLLDVEKKVGELEANIAKAKGKVALHDGQILKIGEDVKKELILVLPEEAKDYEELRKLNGKNLKGVKLNIMFLEKSL